MKKVLALILALLISFLLFAENTKTTKTDTVEQTNSDSTLEDLEADLFSADSETLVTAEKATKEKLTEDNVQLKASLDEASLLLESKKLRIGGRLDSALTLNYLWQDPYSKQSDYIKAFTKPTKAVLETKLAAQLFFDARPSDKSKIYAKFDFGVPFEKEIGGLATARLPTLGKIEAPTVSYGVPNFKVRELYADFSVKDIAFFRFGKHAVKWGTGYFYSPADVLNISRIDPQNPEAEREGALSLRTHIIIPKTQHNIWLYLLPPGKAEGFNPKYTAGAAKAELVLGDWEIGIGGFYRYKKAPRLITSLSGNIANKLNVFAEAVFAWGSDYVYHKNDEHFTAYTQKNKPFFQATVGTSYTNAKSKSTIALQYYYNGFGYKRPYTVLMPASNTYARLKDKESLSKDDSALLQASSTSLRDMLTMTNLGQHYIALSFTQAELGSDSVSLNFFQQFGVSELEALSAVTLNWNIYKPITMHTSLNFTYPLSKKSLSTGSIGWNLGFTLGGGKF